jgi:hypothetical protein
VCGGVGARPVTCHAEPHNHHLPCPTSGGIPAKDSAFLNEVPATPVCIPAGPHCSFGTLQEMSHAHILARLQSVGFHQCKKSSVSPPWTASAYPHAGIGTMLGRRGSMGAAAGQQSPRSKSPPRDDRDQRIGNSVVVVIRTISEHVGQVSTPPFSIAAAWTSKKDVHLTGTAASPGSNAESCVTNISPLSC